MSGSLQGYIDQFFWWCVHAIDWVGEITGMGYNLANIVIFVFLQPALILLFFILWRRAVAKNRALLDEQA